MKAHIHPFRKMIMADRVRASVVKWHSREGRDLRGLTTLASRIALARSRSARASFAHQTRLPEFTGCALNEPTRADEMFITRNTTTPH